ncbi:hypothetical protein [Elizabethkingia anophelis]|uniref:hypothetical protein n=1 Tax=Elizabethkingia anophelis TaxID=1117645 RepID=UPI00320A7954
MEKKTGLTKNEGWQFGIRKTVPVKADIVWDFLFSEEGTALWLKDANREFSTFSTSSHIRTKWKLKNGPMRLLCKCGLFPISENRP